MNDTTHTNGRIEQSERQKAILSPGEVDLRDYFAAKAMQGLLAQSCGTALGSDPIHGAQYAYQMADAMLAARKPNPNQ